MKDNKEKNTLSYTDKDNQTSAPNNYNKLNDVYYSLISCRKIIKESIEIDGVYYNKKTLDNMIKKIEDYRSLIINTFIPQVRYQYNIILNEISKI